MPFLTSIAVYNAYAVSIASQLHSTVKIIFAAIDIIDINGIMAPKKKRKKLINFSSFYYLCIDKRNVENVIGTLVSTVLSNANKRSKLGGRGYLASTVVNETLICIIKALSEALHLNSYT